MSGSTGDSRAILAFLKLSLRLILRCSFHWTDVNRAMIPTHFRSTYYVPNRKNMNFCLFICANSTEGWIMLDDDAKKQPIEFRLFHMEVACIALV